LDLLCDESLEWLVALGLVVLHGRSPVARSFITDPAWDKFSWARVFCYRHTVFVKCGRAISAHEYAADARPDLRRIQSAGNKVIVSRLDCLDDRLLKKKVEWLELIINASQRSKFSTRL
jgi:hypothetical protein